MSILSGSVIVPVEVIGAIQVDGDSALSSSALAGAAQNDADVLAGKKLNTDLGAFSAESSRVSVISALNALGGAISAGGVENITVDEFLTHDGAGTIEVEASAFSASVGYALDNNAAGVQQHITEDAYILELSSGEFTVNVSNLTSSIRGAVSAGGDLSYNSSTGVMSFTERTDAEVRGLVSVTDSGGDGSLAYNSSTGVITYTGPSASEVRAHLSAGGDLSYNSSTGVMSFTERTDAEVRGLVSVTDSGGDGSLAYNSSTGVITYTGPSASEVQAHITAGDGLDVSSGEFSLDLKANGGLAIESTEAKIDQSNAFNPTWEGIHKYDAPLQLLDQDNAGVYYKLMVEDGLLKVVLVP
jgi:hypothetical protein